MFPTFQQAQFAPWNNHYEKPDSFELQNNNNINYSLQVETPGNQNKQQNSNKKLANKQKMGNYAKILPKVYEKGKDFTLNTKTQKTDKNRLEIILKSVSKNDLTIRIPQDPLQLPKVQIQHPIKHTIKSLKRTHRTADTQSDPRSQKMGQRNDNLSELKARVRKSSTDLIHNQSYSNLRKKISIYQEQIVKKCSLKNLKIYSEQEQNQQKIKKLISKKQSNQRAPIPKEKKHILDRILSRLQ